MSGVNMAAEGRTLDFQGSRFVWKDLVGSPCSVTVKVTRSGIQVGCKTLTWAAWDEIKRLVGDM